MVVLPLWWEIDGGCGYGGGNIYVNFHIFELKTLSGGEGKSFIFKELVYFQVEDIFQFFGVLVCHFTILGYVVLRWSDIWRE